MRCGAFTVVAADQDEWCVASAGRLSKRGGHLFVRAVRVMCAVPEEPVHDVAFRVQARDDRVRVLVSGPSSDALNDGRERGQEAGMSVVCPDVRPCGTASVCT